MTISGRTRLYAIVGDPIEQVRSPARFGERFARAGIDAVLVPVHVASARFESLFAALLEVGNLDGVLVTVPFKTRAVPFAQRVGPTARAVGAVNALRREADGTWSANMFDGLGLVRATERKGYRIQGRRVALFGAGGAGSAIAYALAVAGAASIDLIDPDAAKAHALAGRLQPHFQAQRFAVVKAVAPGCDMAVNASPVGMHDGDGLPGDIGALAPASVVGDVVVSAAPTPIIRRAIEEGHGWVSGSEMHEGQIDALLAFFAGGARAAPADRMRGSSEA